VKPHSKEKIRELFHKKLGRILTDSEVKEISQSLLYLGKAITLYSKNDKVISKNGG
jgi:hypothetical protein